jgi:hypothetical protein
MIYFVPHGRVSDGHVSLRRVPHGRASHGRAPHECASHERAPHGCASHGRVGVYLKGVQSQEPVLMNSK